MRRIQSAFFLLIALALCSPAGAETFYLNANGASGKYNIVRFVDGVASPPSPIIGPLANNAGAGIVHAAWPSAFKLPNGKTRVYASRHNGSYWSDIGYWESTDGVSFALVGAALAHDATEPYGIGPSQVYFVPGEARPWHMVYVVRNAAQSGTVIALADSETGEAGSWTRVGTVLESSEPWEAFGVTPSFVVESSPGTWTLFYQGYRDAMYGPAAIAQASSPKGPFTNKRVIMWPSQHEMTLNATRFADSGTVTGTVRIGDPYILRTTGALEVVTPVRQEGNRVWFDRPLFGTYVDGEMDHLLKNKIDPSYVQKEPDGTWSGAFTGYGVWQGVLNEYTFRVTAPSIEGPWTIGDGVPFSPWYPEGLSSTENPAPVVAAE